MKPPQVAWRWRQRQRRRAALQQERIWLLHKRCKMGKAHLVQWFLACSTLGYPVACQVLCIKRADTHWKLKKLW